MEQNAPDRKMPANKVDTLFCTVNACYQIWKEYVEKRIESNDSEIANIFSGYLADKDVVDPNQMMTLEINNTGM